MEHENRGEVNNAKDNQSTQEERGVTDIYKEITKAINDLIQEENPNNKGQDNLENYYNSESEGRDIKGEV
tara:strand:- start:258 stop:467 length:210 start_codon:yes stop_codon:yes gene_type:complete